MNTIKLLVYLFAAGIIFYACSSSNNDSINHLEEGYFSIENSIYIEKAMPDGKDSLINNLTVDKTVTAGGLSTISINTEKQLSYIYVGVKEVVGYYIYSLPQAMKEIRTDEDPPSYNYEVIIKLRPDINVPHFVIRLSSLNVEEGINHIVYSEPIRVE